MKIKIFIFLLFIIACLAFLYPTEILSTTAIKWSHLYDTGGYEETSKICLDSSGNIYICADVETLYWKVIKYDVSGNIVFEITHTNGFFPSEVRDMWLDDSGNIYITGMFDIKDSGIDFDSKIIKFDSSGNTLWTNEYGAGKSEAGSAVAADSSGNVYVAGRSLTTNIFIIKYNSTTGSAVQTNIYDSVDSDTVSDMAIDSSGNIYLAGTLTLTPGNNDFALLKYNSSLNLQWIKTFTTPGNDQNEGATGIVIDRNDNVYVLGSDRLGYGTTIKYDTSGNAFWTNTCSQSGGYGIDVDSSGNPIVIYQVGAFAYDYLVMKLDSATGNEIWNYFYDTGYDDYPMSVAVNTNNNLVYATGNLLTNWNFLTFGIGPAKPESLSSIIPFTNTIVWTWTCPADNEDGFQLQDESHSVMLSMGANTTICTEYGLTPNRRIIRHITSTNALGTTDSDNSTNFTLALPPVSLSSSFTSMNSIKLEWTTNSGGSYGFFLQRATNNAGVPQPPWVTLYSNLTNNISTTSSYSDSGLTLNTKYWYRICSRNEPGILSTWLTNSFTTKDISPPSAPVVISLTIIASNETSIIWNDLPNETSYTLYRYKGTNTNFAALITGFSNNKTNYSDTGLEYGTNYSYRVKAFNAGGGSPFSDTASIWIPLPIVSNVTATLISASNILISWDDIPNETSYSLYRNTSQSTTGVTNIIGLNEDTLFFTNKNLPADTSFFYWVRGFNPYGGSTFSSYASNRTDPIPVPAVPSILSTSPVSSTQIIVVWEDVSLETSYTLFVNTTTNTSGSTGIGNFSTNQTNHTVTGLSPDTDYFFRVQAYNSSGSSDISFYASNRTLPLPVPAIPSILSLSPTSSTQIDVVWENVALETSYTLFVNTTTNTSGSTRIGNFSTNQTNYNAIGLSPDTDYFFRVQAYNSSGASGISFYASNRTLPLPVPAIPAILYSQPISPTEIEVQWENVSLETSYTLYINTTTNISNASKIGGFGINQTNYSFSGLTPDTDYYLWVEAYNSSGGSGVSSMTNAKTAKQVVKDFKLLIIGPNPFKPNDGILKTGIAEKGIIFRNVPSNTKLKVYSVSGGLVASPEETPVNNILTWKVPANFASGVYITLLTTSDGKKETQKIMIIK